MASKDVYTNPKILQSLGKKPKSKSQTILGQDEDWGHQMIQSLIRDLKGSKLLLLEF